MYCASCGSSNSSFEFLSDPGIPGPIYGSGCLKLSPRCFADLTDVTLAGEDTNSILTDNANWIIQSNMVMKVTQPGGQLWNLGK